MARKPRAPRQDELDLWKKVARHAKPLHNAPPDKTPAPAPRRPDPAPKPSPTPAPQPPALQPFRVGEAAKPRTGDVSPMDSLTGGPPAMDKKSFTRMKRGKLPVDARLDLHGMTLAEAHPRLLQFILEAQDRGYRLVLVITGKGKRKHDEGPIPQRVGVLRHSVPHWLRGPALGHAVLQISEAHQSHGGGGAFYVYLRRRR